MDFYVKKRAKPTVAIVSLIDILAILLLFFIVTTTFKEKMSFLKIKLPSSSQEKQGATERLPLVLSVTSDEQIYLDENVVPVERLGQLLLEAKQQQPERPIILKADQDVPFGFLVRVWDQLKIAGMDQISARVLQEAGS